MELQASFVGHFSKKWELPGKTSDFARPKTTAGSPALAGPRRDRFGPPGGAAAWRTWRRGGRRLGSPRAPSSWRPGSVASLWFPLNICIYIYMYLHIYLSIYVFIYLFIYLCVYVYVCMYIYIYIYIFVDVRFCIFSLFYACLFDCLYFFFFYVYNYIGGGSSSQAKPILKLKAPPPFALRGSFKRDTQSICCASVGFPFRHIPLPPTVAESSRICSAHVWLKPSRSPTPSLALGTQLTRTRVALKLNPVDPDFRVGNQQLSVLFKGRLPW